MLGLGFLSPLFLLGIATAAIPVIIHLIHRRKARQVMFSSLMFLRMSHYRTARRRRLHELIMLAIRCALLVLLATAFAGPVLRRGHAGSGDRTQAVLVVDDSFSMQYEHAGTTSFERARDAAASIIDMLPLGSEAALLFTSANRDREVAELTPNLLELRGSVLSAEPSAMATPVAPTLARAVDILAAGPWQNFEVYVLTDLQRSAWNTGGVPAKQGETGLSLFSESTDVNVVIVDCGAEQPDNLALSDLIVKRRARGGSIALAFGVDVRNFSQRAGEITLSLRTGAADTELRSSESVSVSAGDRTRVSFQEMQVARSRVVGCAAMPPDALAIDDTRYFALSAGTGTRVLLVGDDDPYGSTSDLFYIHAALTLGSSPFETFTIATDELLTMRLDHIDVIVAGQMAGMSMETAAVLRDFVHAGGGLVLFLGPDISPARYNETFGSPDSEGRRLLPALLFSTVESPEEERFTFDQIDMSHPVFEMFTGLNASALSFVRTRAYLATQDAGQRARVLARYSDGGAAVLQKSYGTGRVVLFTTSIDGEWSNLPLRASFVPIVHRAITYLAEENETVMDQHRVGQPIEFAFPVEDGPVSMEIVSPDGVKHVVTSELKDGHNRATFRAADVPGVYTISTDAPRNDVPAEVAVNVDTSESDLTRMSRRGLDAILPGARLYSAASVGQAAGSLTRERGGVKLWGMVIALLVAVSLAESVLASLFTRRLGPAGVRARSMDFVVVPKAARQGERTHA